MALIVSLLALLMLLFGWWGPAVAFYGFGLVALGRIRHQPHVAYVWLALFLATFAVTAFDGLYRHAQFEKRAVAFNDINTYFAAPDDVRTIVIPREDSGTLTDSRRDCTAVCMKLLLGKRFDRVIIADKVDIRGDRVTRDNQSPYFRAYARVDRPGCRTLQTRNFFRELRLWELSGRCIEENPIRTVEGPRIELLLDHDAPDHPGWPAAVRHLRVVDSHGTRDIARAERASVDFFFWFPVPGIFPHSMMSDWRPGLWSFHRSYGRIVTPIQLLDHVFNVALNGPMPKPVFAGEAPDERLVMAPAILLYRSQTERHRFIRDELGAMRPLSPAFRNVVLDFIQVSEFKLGATDDIAWLVADDPELGPVVAKALVDRIADQDAPWAEYLVPSLRHFRPELWEPHLASLIAAHRSAVAKRGERVESLDRAFASLGSAIVPMLIDELGVPPRLESRAAAAAAALCRIGDLRAVEPLLERMRSLKAGKPSFYPMSYAYALARMGHGEDARSAIAAIRDETSPERQCLDEVVAAFPRGGAPESICVMRGPTGAGKDPPARPAPRCLAPGSD
jgi:hypothetical protein